MTAQSQIEHRPRVNLRRLVTLLLFSGVIPLVLLIGLDILLGWLPLLTIAGLVVFIPLGSFLVVRAALDEFSRIVDEVAPEDDGNDQWQEDQLQE